MDDTWVFRSSPGMSSTRRRSTWEEDRKSTRLNSSHDQISYAVFCLKKKKKKKHDGRNGRDKDNNVRQGQRRDTGRRGQKADAADALPRHKAGLPWDGLNRQQHSPR